MQVQPPSTTVYQTQPHANIDPVRIPWQNIITPPTIEMADPIVIFVVVIISIFAIFIVATLYINRVRESIERDLENDPLLVVERPSTEDAVDLDGDVEYMGRGCLKPRGSMNQREAWVDMHRHIAGREGFERQYWV